MRPQQAGPDQPVKDAVEQDTVALLGDQASPELGQDRRVEPWIRQVKGEGVLPVDAAADGIGSLAVRQSFRELEDRDKGQSPR
jgi:hypothetical protein